MDIPPHHNRFTALFPGPPGWAGARRELLDFVVQGKINRGRHTDHPAGCHSIWTKQCPPPPSSSNGYTASRNRLYVQYAWMLWVTNQLYNSYQSNGACVWLERWPCICVHYPTGSALYMFIHHRGKNKCIGIENRRRSKRKKHEQRTTELNSREFMWYFLVVHFSGSLALGQM